MDVQRKNIVAAEKRTNNMYIMKTKPWGHQLKALDYLMVRHYGALYTDMGSGKTKVGIDLIVNRGFNLTLIVGTKKSCDVWQDEFKKHYGGSEICVFKLSNLSTSSKITKLNECLDQIKEKHIRIVLIINYDSIWIKPFSEKLIKAPIDCIICDESHRIKTPGSKCSLYLTRIGKKVPNRFLFTGTPSTESPLDVYAQYRFLQPAIFGTNYSVFRDRYENVDINQTMRVGYRVLNKKQPYLHLDELKEKMYSCAFYVTPNIKLPETTDIVIHYTPSKQLIDIYKEVKKEGVYENENGVLEINNARTKVLREQQILSGYVPLEDFTFTKKFVDTVDYTRQNTLQELLEGIRKDEKIVIFAKFRYDFDCIQNVCKTLNREYGEISGVRDDYELWKRGEINTIAVHYKSGSESIDLTQARYCIYYTLSHSYGLYRQSRKRVHRPGQTRPVVYYSIVAKIPRMITVDEKIVKALENKQDVAEYLLNSNSRD